MTAHRPRILSSYSSSGWIRDSWISYPGSSCCYQVAHYSVPSTQPLSQGLQILREEGSGWGREAGGQCSREKV